MRPPPASSQTKLVSGSPSPSLSLSLSLSLSAAASSFAPRPTLIRELLRGSGLGSLPPLPSVAGASASDSDKSKQRWRLIHCHRLTGGLRTRLFCHLQPRSTFLFRDVRSREASLPG
ncbi:hypothetical protein OPV22_009641 [Ensete ventricosum]|uniref:Secreted protein n=1 Tax=Ensete ventricosum TaxID=4639 RepID=A0AAV8PT68_ENSVE|nr:hypothetical protein OPV22_009641 [Ensete ventricosum]